LYISCTFARKKIFFFQITATAAILIEKQQVTYDGKVAVVTAKWKKPS
jgi:hypothetical protein